MTLAICVMAGEIQQMFTSVSIDQWLCLKEISNGKDGAQIVSGNWNWRSNGDCVSVKKKREEIS